MWGKIAAGAIIISSITFAAPIGHADPPPPGCERVPILGLNPQIREICDTPIQSDGTWIRFRSFSHPTFVHSTCGDYGVMTRTGYYCPDWAPLDTSLAAQSSVDQYILTADTIPPGEPGHIG